MLNINQLEAIVFDFDGVLTDNLVYVNQKGEEMVRCSRSDGLAFDVLRETSLKLFILSKEENDVVAARAKKLKIPAYKGVDNKASALQQLAKQNNFHLKNTMFVGNDVNDIAAMKACGYSACPSDSHPAVKKIATFQLKKGGGEGVVRELVEKILKIDTVKSLS